MSSPGRMGGAPSQRMFAIAKELLWRQRIIHPFPCGIDELLCSLLPAELQDFVLCDAESNGFDVQWANLTQCVTLGQSVVVEIDGETGKAFWLSWIGARPVPTVPGKSLSIYKSNLHWRGIVDWYGPALETHKKLIKHEQTLCAFFHRADHPDIVERYWPELIKFVDFTLAPNQALSVGDKKKRRVVPMPTREEVVDIIETLAGSTLLAPHRCDAWVGYEMEE